MNTPHPLALEHRIDLGREATAPSTPVFYLNPPLAHSISRQYKAEVRALLNTSPPGRRFTDDPALSLFASESPEVLAGYFETWFSPDTPIQTLVNATQIVYETDQAAGIEQANDEIIRRLQTVAGGQVAADLCLLAHWDPQLMLPHVKQLLQRLPTDPKVVYMAIMKLDELGSYELGSYVFGTDVFGTDEPLELPQPTVELLKSWFASGSENQQYIAVQGLAHTPFRETQAFGDHIRSRIATGERLYVIDQTAFNKNPAPWVQEALNDLRDGAEQQPQYAQIVCEFGDQKFADFYRTQLKQHASADAMAALRRVVGDDQAISFLKQNLDSRPLLSCCLLLDNAGEDAIPDCVQFLANSDDEELHKDLIDQIVRRKLGIGNSDLLNLVEKVYRNACETDFRINAKQLLNALTRLGHPDPTSLAKLLPGPDTFESPAVTMAENDLTLQDFIDFLHSRQDRTIDPKLLGRELDVGVDRSFGLQYMLNDALLQTPFAMEFCPEDWSDQYLDVLFQKLASLTGGTFVPDGIRFEKRVEISWKDTVYADELGPYCGCPGGLIEMINAILDHSDQTTSRFVSYPNESGNGDPIIVFLSAADAKTLETRFGLKPRLSRRGP